jgi:ABC-type transport system substrate-binding protein
MRRLRVHPLVLTLVAAAALAAGATSAAASTTSPHLAGSWSGHYSGAYSGTLKLHWTQSGTRLSGSITLSNPHGTYRVTGTVKGTSIKFGAVTVGATYTGAVSGKTMSGRYKSAGGGGRWSAHRT